MRAVVLCRSITLFKLAAVLLALASLSGARAECMLNRAASLPLILWQQKLFVGATVNGIPSYFFIDTGAASTTLSQALADGQNLLRDFDHAADTFGVGGVESQLTIVQAHDVAIGPVRLLDRSFPVAVFAERMSDGSPVGGLIGADILSRFDLDLDLPGRRLGLWRVSGCSEVKPDWPGDAQSAPLDIAPSRHVAVPVRIDGATLDLLIDTGAPNVVLSTRAAARAGATPDILEQNHTLSGRGVNDRRFAGWMHIFGRLEVAGQVFGDVPTVVVAPSRVQMGDGLLGLEFLKRGRVWISYSTGKFFVEKTPP